MIFRVPKELKFLDSVLKSMIHSHDYSINLSNLQRITIDTLYTKAWNKIKSLKGLFGIDNKTYDNNFLSYSLKYLEENKLIYSAEQDIYTLTLDGIVKIRKGGFKMEMISKDLRVFWFWLLSLISVSAFILSVNNSLNLDSNPIKDTCQKQKTYSCQNK